MKNINFKRSLRRKLRVSSNFFGTAERPRVSVFRSNKFVYAQAIDDANRKTIAGIFSKKLVDTKEKKSKTIISKLVGVELAKLLLAKDIKKAIFDRGEFAYQGRVKAVAEGLREGGIIV